MGLLEKKAIEIIRNWSIRKERIEVLIQKVKENESTILSNLYFVHSSSNSSRSSLVESIAIKRADNERLLNSLISEMNLYQAVFSKAPLTNLERDLIKNLSEGTPLKKYAHSHKITPFYRIYKIQNSAVKKLVKEYRLEKDNLLTK